MGHFMSHNKWWWSQVIAEVDFMIVVNFHSSTTRRCVDFKGNSSKCTVLYIAVIFVFAASLILTNRLKQVPLIVHLHLFIFTLFYQALIRHPCASACPKDKPGWSYAPWICRSDHNCALRSYLCFDVIFTFQGSLFCKTNNRKYIWNYPALITHILTLMNNTK